MLKKMIALVATGVLLSGCYMVPLALVGPAASGFSTASIVQSGITTGAGYIVKKSTGKTITQHALDAIDAEILQQSYFPINKFKSISIVVGKK